MVYLNYVIVRFNDIKNLNKNELLILAYIDSNKKDTTLTLHDWSILLNTSIRNVTRAINKLTISKKIINKSTKNKLILKSIYNQELEENQEQILKDFYNKLK